MSLKPTEARNKAGRQTSKATTNVGKPGALSGVPRGPARAAIEKFRDVTELLAETINHLRAGKLDPRVANAVGYLATALLAALLQQHMFDCSQPRLYIALLERLQHWPVWGPVFQL